jgi:DNA-3-methyladenine glycosylase
VSNPTSSRWSAAALLLLVAGLGFVGGIVAETEAYAPDDPASHSYGGPSARNAAMFGPPGRAYVYRSYGIHWCFNVVCSTGSAVLVRALQPTSGLERIMERRGTNDMLALGSGPGKLTQALAIGREHDGQPLQGGGLALRPTAERPTILVGPRIGNTKAVDRLWRFGIAGSLHLSRPFPRSLPGGTVPPR